METKKEVYLGGISSGDLVYRGFPGNGLHATDRRLFLVKSGSPMLGGLFGSFGGAILGGERSGKLTGKSAARKISWLERKSYFELDKGDIVRLDLKDPANIRWSMLRIVPKTGETVDLLINSVRDFQMLKTLLGVFAPEILRIV